MRHFLKSLTDAVPVLLLILGAGTVAAGTALIALPLGLIVLGAELITASILMIRGDDRG